MYGRRDSSHRRSFSHSGQHIAALPANAASRKLTPQTQSNSSSDANSVPSSTRDSHDEASSHRSPTRYGRALLRDGELQHPMRPPLVDTSSVVASSSPSDSNREARMSASSAPTSVERKVEQLSEAAQRLSKVLTAETAANASLRAQFDRSPTVTVMPALKGAQLQPISLAQLQAENLRLLQLLEEERANRVELRDQYEHQLRLLRGVLHNRQTDGARKHKDQVQRQVDQLVQRYYALAKEAVSVARQEAVKSKSESRRIQRIAETACRAFEADLKQQTHKALEEYRQLAQNAKAAAQKDRENHTAELESMRASYERQQTEFQVRIMQEAEKRVAGCRKMQESLEQQLADNAASCQKTIDDLCEQVEAKCLAFERKLLGKVLQVMWDHGMDIDERALRSLLAAADSVSLPAARNVTDLTPEELRHRLAVARHDRSEGQFSGSSRIEYSFGPSVTGPPSDQQQQPSSEGEPLSRD